MQNKKGSHLASGGSYEKDQELSFTQNLQSNEFMPINQMKNASLNSRKSRDPSQLGSNKSNHMSSRKHSSGSGSGSRGLASNRSGMATLRYPVNTSNPGSFNSN